MRKTRSLVPIALFLVFLCSLVVMPAQAAETWAQGFESWNEGLPNGMIMQNGESIASFLIRTLGFAEMQAESFADVPALLRRLVCCARET